MSKYTSQLRYIYNQNPDDVIDTFTSYKLEDYLTPTQIEVLTTHGAWSKQKLADKIIKNYYFHEIGFETWAMFRHFTIIEMEKLMEYYLPLIYSRSIEYDPLINVDYTEKYSGENIGNNLSNSKIISKINSINNDKNKFSDTPNVGLENIENDRYLTNAAFTENTMKNDQSSDSENSGSSTGKQWYTKNIRGNSGVSATAQKMVEQFRENIIAIDHKIIEDLAPLFMMIY